MTSSASAIACHSVEGVEVRQRSEDGYVNATALARAHFNMTGERRKANKEGSDND